jgi:hypothetical protein
VYDHYALYNIAIPLSGKNYVVPYETETGYYPVPGSRATRSKCARGVDGSTQFDTTEKRCLRASFTNPRFVTKAVREPDEFTSLVEDFCDQEPCAVQQDQMSAD